MTGNNRQRRARHCTLFAGILIAGWLFRGSVFGQAKAQAPAESPAASQVIQQAETVRIPVHAFSRVDTSPIQDLQPTDLTLDVDGKPASFQLSRPWSRTINPKTGQAEDEPNLLIILPAADPLDRHDVINEAVAALKAMPPSGWNISILDDSGDQTAYTRNIPLVITELEKVGAESPMSVSLADWRHTACVAIASMRDLPGRRVVLSLGDLFHEVLYQGYSVAYDAFEVLDVSTAARAAGVILYSADSSREIEVLRRLPEPYSILGSGPRVLLAHKNLLAGWISDSVAATLQQIRNDAMAAYDMDLHLSPKQMDGRPHIVSVTPKRKQMIFSAPWFYPAPNLAQLQEFALGSAALRKALRNPVPDPASPLQLGVQVEYFPHRDGKTGTQVISTGMLWTPTTPPPTHLEVGQQLEEATTGVMMTTLVRRLEWYSAEPTWNTAVDVVPGEYRLRVAAADPTGKITAGLSTDFTVAPPDPEESVRISSVVVGRSCVFSPPPPDTGSPQPHTIDYLRAGNCTIQPEPSLSFSPQDVLWTLVRITPVDKLASRPSKDWKGDFVLVNASGSKIAHEPIHWLTAEDGSYVGTAAFQLGNPKLKPEDGEYAVVFKLKGPGIEPDYYEDAPFLLYGAGGNDDGRHARK